MGGRKHLGKVTAEGPSGVRRRGADARGRSEKATGSHRLGQNERERGGRAAENGCDTRRPRLAGVLAPAAPEGGMILK